MAWIVAEWFQVSSETENTGKSRLASWLILVSSLLFQVGMEGAPRDDSRTHKQTLNHKEGNCICLCKQDLATEIPQRPAYFYLNRKAEVRLYSYMSWETTDES